jgi:TolB-like protein/DNA-binding winged helix-turn-helix (wHTH) protein/Tfp pilus assembly protein PilF
LSDRKLTGADGFQLGGYQVEPSRLRVTIDGVEVRLEAKVMLVLVYLAEHAGRVVSREEFEEQLWPGRVVTEDSVTKAIAKLRRVFEDDAHEPRVIETVPKSGYRLIADVARIDQPVEDAGAASVPAGASEARGWGTARRWLLGTASGLLLLLASWAVLEQDRAGHVPSGVPPRPSVAVVPFENLGVAPEEDYFANGITADLITDLSRVQGLLVIAPGTVFAYTESRAGLGKISAELEVDYLVIGSVQRQASTLRINVQLIEASTERALWGERYAGLMNDVFDMQDKLTAAVIAALKVELAPSERAILATRPAVSVLAYDHYLRGLEEHGSRTQAQNLSARAQFEEAIALDPSFARAHAGLALTYSREAIDGWATNPAEALELAAGLADQAARMDPSLPQVYFVKGQVELFRRRHERAIVAAERAVSVDPNYADAYALLAWTLNYAGRPNRAMSALEQAMRLNPRPPASYLEILGEIQFTKGRFEESSTTFQRVLGYNPGYTRARMWNAAALAMAGLVDLAEWEVTELLIANPGFSLARLDFAFPFKDPRAREQLLDGLRKAGLPAR